TWRDWKTAAGAASRGAARGVTAAADLTGRAAGHGLSLWRGRSWSFRRPKLVPVSEAGGLPPPPARVEPRLSESSPDDEEDEAPPSRPAPRKIVAPRPRAAPGKREAAERQPTLVLGGDEDYTLPDLGLLTAPRTQKGTLGALDEAALARNAQL